MTDSNRSGVWAAVTYCVIFCAVTAAWHFANGTPEVIAAKIADSMVFIEGGPYTFIEDDTQHRDTVSGVMEDYYLCDHEVTRLEWQVVMGSLPQNYETPLKPVMGITFFTAQEFVRRLNEMTPDGPFEYAIPTEPQWVYASAGGKYADGYPYPESTDYAEIAWTHDSSDSFSGVPGDVKQLRPNVLGLYDMLGNAEEYCQPRTWDPDTIMGCTKHDDCIRCRAKQLGHPRIPSLVTRGGNYSCYYHSDYHYSTYGPRDTDYDVDVPETDLYPSSDSDYRYYRTGLRLAAVPRKNK